MSTFEVSFPGGVRVDATYRGHVVHTDQPSPLGTNTAMSPFDLFLASIATCMGFYAVRFCQERDLATDGMGLALEPERDERKHLRRIRVSFTAPDGFPEKYQSAILRAMEQCAVKKALAEPPEFELGFATTTALRE